MHTKRTTRTLIRPLLRALAIGLLAGATACGGHLDLYDEELAQIDGWDADLAEWQAENPGLSLDDDQVDDDQAEVDQSDADQRDAEPSERPPDDVTMTFDGCRDASGGKRNHLTMFQVGKLARKVGIPCGPRLVTAIAIAAAESANYQYRWHRNTNCTKDIGLWQINNYYHPDYAKTNLITNARGMKRISGKGRRWTAWYARNTAQFRKYRKEHACNAGQRICGWSKTSGWRKRHCFCSLTSCN